MSQLRILVLHNRYQQPGGEDAVVASEVALLRSHGHDVALLEFDNDSIHGFLSRAKTALRATYSGPARRAVRRAIQQEQPDIVHVHNLFPVFSPSAYFACSDAGVPVVQTLHNYRLVCPGAQLFRDGALCERCIGRIVPVDAIRYRCYRDSLAGSASVACMSAVHQSLRTYEKHVSMFIAVSEFVRQKYIEAGFAEAMISVKPNFVTPDPGIGSRCRDYFLFAGRLSEEKGIHTLLAAWRRMDARLVIVGDGPLAATVRAAWQPNIEFAGRRGGSDVLELLKGARALIFPSLWYEGMPRIIVEAFATGTPVIATRLGAMETMISDHETGLHFSAGDSANLAAQASWAWQHGDLMSLMGRNSRRHYETNYTAERNYKRLITIYERAIRRFVLSNSTTRAASAA